MDEASDSDEDYILYDPRKPSGGARASSPNEDQGVSEDEAVGSSSKQTKNKRKSPKEKKMEDKEMRMKPFATNRVLAAGNIDIVAIVTKGGVEDLGNLLYVRYNGPFGKGEVVPKGHGGEALLTQLRAEVPSPLVF